MAGYGKTRRLHIDPNDGVEHMLHTLEADAYQVIQGHSSTTNRIRWNVDVDGVILTRCLHTKEEVIEELEYTIVHEEGDHYFKVEFIPSVVYKQSINMPTLNYLFEGVSNGVIDREIFKEASDIFVRGFKEDLSHRFIPLHFINVLFQLHITDLIRKK
jgi:hypothetical protein